MDIKYFKLAISLSLIGIICACDNQSQRRHRKSDTAVALELKEFELGWISLDELAERDGTAGRQRILDYFETHPVTTSLTMKLAVSHCYAMEGRYSEAAALAEQYVGVYSNDYRGWRIIGSANLQLNLVEKGFWGYTNAVILGGAPDACAELGAAALKHDRLDLAHGVVPQLLEQRYDGSLSIDHRAQVLAMLADYAVRSGESNVFLAAVTNLPVAEFETRPEAAHAVLQACEEFASPQVAAVCELAKAVAQEGGSNESPAQPSGSVSVQQTGF
jgi:hypothetical protein